MKTLGTNINHLKYKTATIAVFFIFNGLKGASGILVTGIGFGLKSGARGLMFPFPGIG